MNLSRRRFLKRTLAGTGGVLALPTLVPSSVFGQSAPSKKIQILQIGCGRIAREMDLPGLLRQDGARVVAVCDLDSRRLADGRKMVEDHYAKKSGGSVSAVKTTGDYRQLLASPDIDAVAISTPDHWHAEPVIRSVLAGKDVYVQKPLSMTVAEGRAVSDAVRKSGRIFQIGSQQRSDSPWPQFRRVCERVRNGRIGTLKTVRIGLPTDPAGAVEPDMPVPPNLNYDHWLGCTPQVPYTEKRVHPQADYSRPGWLRIESYCLGMITGWGSHHVDIAHWGMDTELAGPVEIEGRAEFPKSGLWNVHGAYHIEARYANGVTVIIDNNNPNGVRFEGADGWLFVSREAAQASDPKLLESAIGSNDVHLHTSPDQHLDWLTSIRTRQPGATNAEQAHRSTTACILGWAAMKLGRKLRWDPARERFVEDDEANGLLTRPQRSPFGTGHISPV